MINQSILSRVKSELKPNERILWAETADRENVKRVLKKGELKSSWFPLLIYFCLSLFSLLQGFSVYQNTGRLASKELFWGVLILLILIFQLQSLCSSENTRPSSPWKPTFGKFIILFMAGSLLYRTHLVYTDQIPPHPQFSVQSHIIMDLVLFALIVILYAAYWMYIYPYSENGPKNNRPNFDHYIITNERLRLFGDNPKIQQDIFPGTIDFVYIYEPKSSNYLTLTFVDDPDMDRMIGLDGVLDFTKAEKLIAEHFIVPT